MREYMVSQGDVWDLVSFICYGNEKHIDLLIRANPEHRHTVMFEVPATVMIPDLPVSQTESVMSLPPWRR